MAGSQDPSDNPVAVNVVPLVDIIFCLCVFFMCSFKFKQMEGKFDTWLPKDAGVSPRDLPVDPATIVHDVRVAIVLDEATGRIERKLGIRSYPDDAELGAAIVAQHEACARLGRPDAPVTLDADSRVPWTEVVRVVDLARGRGLGRFEFAMGAAPARRR